MNNVHGFDFVQLHFDEQGRAQSGPKLSRAAARATDVLLLAHGFRNAESEATGWYTEFLRSLSANMARAGMRAKLAQRSFVAAGIYWPSKPFNEELPMTEAAGTDALRAKLEDMKRTEVAREQRSKINEAISLLPELETSLRAQDRFVRLVLGAIPSGRADRSEGLPDLKRRRGSEVLAGLAAPVVVRTHAGQAEGTGMALGSIIGGLGGRVGQFLNMTTWYIMKSRSGAVGAAGVADAVRELKGARPEVRVHLIGHSLGGRLMAACAQSLAKPPKVQADSVSLLQAAFSHYGFSRDNGFGAPGFFRGVIGNKAVKGPLIATFSAEDDVVGRVYAVASRLARDTREAVGDAGDPFGGIGRNGAQRTDESISGKLLPAGAAYEGWRSGVVINLDASGGGVRSHGDITNERVTWAVATAIAAA